MENQYQRFFKELEKDISEDVIEKRNFDGMEYISVDVFKDRLDEVIGVDHYTEEYSECKIVTLKIPSPYRPWENLLFWTMIIFHLRPFVHRVVLLLFSLT